MNALSGTGSPTFSLTDNNFEIASGSISVKATAALDYEDFKELSCVAHNGTGGLFAYSSEAIYRGDRR